jgi:hypothetical protein
MRSIALATEDELSEEVGKKLIKTFCPNFDVGPTLRRGGNGYLRSRIGSFNQMAAHQLVLVITDLDSLLCPLELLQGWCGNKPISANLIIRVAVREIESWLLADHDAMKKLLVKGAAKLPENPDALVNPKAFLLNLARRAPRSVREDLCKGPGVIAAQGIGYNRRLADMTRRIWEPHRAAERSTSLIRACRRLQMIE